MYTIEQITGVYLKYLYPFQQKDYMVNLFGIRHSDMKSNAFNDTLGCFIYKPDGKPFIFTAKGTTDAGFFYRQNPIDKRGVAVLPKGFYPKLWKIGMHQGKYPALQQNTPVAVYRDNDKDSELEYVNLQKPEMIGLNFHHAGQNSVQVDKWSATCQVVAALADWDVFWKVIQEQKQNTGIVTFDYALFEQKDFTF